MNIVDIIHAVLGDLNIPASEREWVINQYSEPWRKYHNLKHIERMLTQLKTDYLSLYNDPFVAYAVIMHDVVYVPGASDNEQRSCDKALDLIKDYKDIDGNPIDGETIDLVKAIIMATDHKEKSYNTTTPAIIADIDLVGLADDYCTFVFTGNDIMLEAKCSLDDFVIGRTKFFLSMLNKTPIFQTPKYQNLELIARHNMTTWINAIVQQLVTERV